jgi:4-alpha-glucanotransferase
VRASGILLHPTSLPGRFGIGDLGSEADAFLDWLQSAGQTIWQILPLGPIAYGNSPYGCLSAFAGNHLLISPEELVREGLLPAEALVGAPAGHVDTVDFSGVIPWKDALLRQCWDYTRKNQPGDILQQFDGFCGAFDQRYWLEDWVLFAALKQKFNGEEWFSWPRELKLREHEAVEAAKAELGEEMVYQRFVQFLFFRQWDRVRREANRRNILIMGDIPIYVSADSADVWAYQRYFCLDSEAKLETIAGVPPDYFSETGQLWGNPLYRWDRIETEGFTWWVERARNNFRTADIVRIDHFRGFAGFWEVKMGEKTAVNGRWVTGPGMKLFNALQQGLGRLPFVAEDLGVITDDVRELVYKTGFPGMKILQFGFTADNEEYQPHRYGTNCVVYTGTHDNDTIRGFWAEAPEDIKKRVIDYTGTDGHEIEWDMIRTAFTSVADLAMFPAQDVFGLGNEARMNTPGLGAGNWGWRAKKSDFTKERAERLLRLAKLTGRKPYTPKPE